MQLKENTKNISTRDTFAPGPHSVEEVTGSPDYAPLVFISRMAERYGDYNSYISPLGRVHLVHNPLGIQEVLRNGNFERKHLTALVLGNGLLNSTGRYWRQQRKLMQSYLTRQKLTEMLPTIVNQTENLGLSWRQKLGRSGVINISDEFKCFTRDIILRLMFSTDLGAEASTVTKAMDVAMPFLGGLLGMLFQDATTWSPEGQIKLKRNTALLNELMYSMIEERRQDKDPPPDLLTGLLSLVDNETRKPLTDQQIRDELLTMLIAGHETTAITLGWLAYLLTIHQDQQDRVFKEVASVLDDSPVGLDKIRRLTYTQWAIKESMRLYPPIWQITRRVAAADRINGYSVKPDDTVVCCVYTAHRHREYWSDPERYFPGRFSTPNSAFMPFGFGGHICVGQHLAMLEATAVISILLREFEFCSVAQESVLASPWFSLRIKDGLRLQIRSRT